MIIDLHTHPFGNPDFNPGDAIQSRRDVVTLRSRRPDIFRSRYVNVQDLTDRRDVSIKLSFNPGLRRTLSWSRPQ
jgi:hypothetical protein